MDSNKKVVFVSGASVGFGREIAKKFVKEGYNVIATARRRDKLLDLQRELGEDNCQIIVSDIRNVNNIKSQIENLHPNFREVDILINNAGLALGLSSFEEALIEDIETMIEVNILALVRLTHLFLPSMVKKLDGHIINIGSIAGSYPYPGGNIYGATKAFVKQFSLNLRADLYDKNIRVTNIEPGLSGGSEFSYVRFKGDVNKASNVYKNTKPLLPMDIANMVFFACSQDSYVNINRIEIMPTMQAPGALNVFKDNE